MDTTDVVVVGAGPAGLATSACLRERAIDHVVLERHEAASAWRTQRWDSLRLLTPNWLARLPGWRYDGADPDGYMTAAEVVAFLDGYRRAIDAPVRSGRAVRAVTRTTSGYAVTTADGELACRALVVATGACGTPRVPPVARRLPASIRQLTPLDYRRPDDAGDGRVLVVGASASGAQIADELARSGRAVTIAVGAHTRVPRTYRGHDIHWWLDAIGALDVRSDAVDDLARARRSPSLQLVGSSSRRSLDVGSLRELGVDVVGRLVGVDGMRVQFAGSLALVCADADLKLGRLLDDIDRFAARHALDVGAVDRPAPTSVPRAATSGSLRGCSAVVWATGYRPEYPWLPAECLDGRGAVVHDGGVMAMPGAYVLGLPFTRRRRSSFLDGFGPDARYVTSRLARHLDAVATRCA